MMNKIALGLVAVVALGLAGFGGCDKVDTPAPVNLCKGLDATACAANPDCQLEGKEGGEQHCGRK